IIFIQGERSNERDFINLKIFEETEDPSDYARISIEASGNGLEQVPFLILPLFAPDLPIYLLWGEDPTTENKILPHLQKIAVRLIFDSECSEDFLSFSQHMKHVLTSSIDIIDMNWARIAGWRELISQIFDSKDRLNQLQAANRIKIIYNKLPSSFFKHPDTQALYLQGWLASRFGWEFKSLKKEGDDIQLIYEKEGRPLEIHLIGKTRSDLLPEEIIEIEGSSHNGFVFQMVREDKNQVIVHTCNQYQCQLPFTLFLPTLRTGRGFMQEIFYQKPSSHYKEMLALVSSMTWSKNGKL
ncbi:MAG: glucose-6-phosphate dehydrogenase assembly protein OpcA, partial [Parachlamydia sp.]|nr:glucose-6-phosphate dehydrogenase assembly protein OpcA [Parachlamydia sp.]